MPVKKQKAGSGPHIRKRTTNPPLRFPFQFFDGRDAEMCPGSFREGYTRALMERLRDLSRWTVQQFTSCNDKSVRAHTHDWAETARPDGFSNLNDHYSGYPGWQFCLTANERGRVHGILIDDTFYVIWLDQDHRLYP